MSAAGPTSREAFLLAPGALASLAPAGLDVGHVTAKVAFVESSPEQDILHCATFPVDQLSDAVAFLRANAATAKQLRVTGNTEAATDAVREVWGADAVMVKKLEARIAGSHFLVKNVPCEQLEMPVEGGTAWTFEGGMMDRFKEMMQSHMANQKKPEEGSTFPAVIVSTGRVQTLWIATAENEAKKLTVSPVGSQTLNGLVSLLVGRQSLSELDTTASRGNVQNVDTVVKEVISTDPNSPYGRFPEDMPIFPFGKAYDYNKDLSEFAKEDLAASLVRMFAGTSLMDSIGCVMDSGVTRVFVGGSLFNLTLARKAWDELLRSYFSMLGAKTVFAKLQHACAVGAMLADTKGCLEELDVQRA